MPHKEVTTALPLPLLLLGWGHRAPQWQESEVCIQSRGTCVPLLRAPNPHVQSSRGHCSTPHGPAWLSMACRRPSDTQPLSHLESEALSSLEQVYALLMCWGGTEEGMPKGEARRVGVNGPKLTEALWSPGRLQLPPAPERRASHRPGEGAWWQDHERPGDPAPVCKASQVCPVTVTRRNGRFCFCSQKCGQHGHLGCLCTRVFLRYPLFSTEA